MVVIRATPLDQLSPEEAKARVEKIKAAVKRADDMRAKAYAEVIRGLKETAKKGRTTREIREKKIETSSTKTPTSPTPQSSPPTASGTAQSKSAELRKWSKLFLRIRWAQIKRADREEKAAEAAAEKELEAIRKELAERKAPRVTLTPVPVTSKDEEVINTFLEEWGK